MPTLARGTPKLWLGVAVLAALAPTAVALGASIPAPLVGAQLPSLVSSPPAPSSALYALTRDASAGGCTVTRADVTPPGASVLFVYEDDAHEAYAAWCRQDMPAAH